MLRQSTRLITRSQVPAHAHLEAHKPEHMNRIRDSTRSVANILNLEQKLDFTKRQKAQPCKTARQVQVVMHDIHICVMHKLTSKQTGMGFSRLSVLEMMSLSLLDRMKKAYGIVSGSGIGPPMAAKMPNKAPIFLVLPTLLSMI